TRTSPRLPECRRHGVPSAWRPAGAGHGRRRWARMSLAGKRKSFAGGTDSAGEWSLLWGQREQRWQGWSAMSAEDLEKYETEMELQLYREYRDIVRQFSYVVETERRFYLAN